MKKRIYILVIVLTGGLLSTQIQSKKPWYERPVSLVNEWIVQPIVGFVKRLFTMLVRGGRRSLVTLTAMVRRQEAAPPAEAEHVVDDTVLATDFTPDCAVQQENNISFYQIKHTSFKLIRKPTLSNVQRMFVSPDSTRLCIVYTNRTELLQINLQKQLIRLHTFNKTFDEGKWSPDNTVIALRDNSRTVRLIDSTTKDTIKEIHNVVQMAWSPRIRFFAAVTQAGNVEILWHQAGWQTVANDLKDVQSIAWSPRRDFLLVTTRDGASTLYKPVQELTRFSMQEIILQQNHNTVKIPNNSEVVFSPTAGYVALIDGQKKLSLFKVGHLTGNTLGLIATDIGTAGILSFVKSVLWTDEAQIAVLVEDRKDLSIYSMQGGVFKFTHTFAADIKDIISLSKNRQYLLVRQEDTNYFLYDLKSLVYQQLLRKLQSFTNFYWLS